MYVIAYDDIPDEIVFDFDKMEAKLSELGAICAYYYRFEGRSWYARHKYYLISHLVHEITAGDWNTSPQYMYYGDPNSCKTCKSQRFMQGNQCMSCNACRECKEIAKNCLCGN
jgi:hypothetical protein